MQIIKYQQGIMDVIPRSAIYLLFSLNEKKKGHLKETLMSLQKLVDGQEAVLGLGEKVMKEATNSTYEVYTPEGKEEKLSPKGDCDLALWLRDEDEGVLLHKARQYVQVLSAAFEVMDIVRGCTYLARKEEDDFVNHDLSGFVDGTANPKGEERLATAIVQTGDDKLVGSSFWALQKWRHNFNWLDKASQQAKEEIIGRSLTDNHEFEHKAAFSHIERTEQESFDPEAFMWRKSMPWYNDALEGGLMFSCFATSFRAFKVQLNRMCGNEDGIVDGLFRFSKIHYTTFLWCPPFVKGKLDLSSLNLS
ncbi:Dyp-type peroxidase [Fangia hongkongensis]|uniref:Dyp-type peroxidase n=1 Tax=Fangia hongkongensis TaxID=270495 RepID=UPI000379C81C|nr:Dyp-type peroxidase [Fangia hongkongensis]MBK2125446.1 Dyp-type peroxidase [Fangia hongkongensis]